MKATHPVLAAALLASCASSRPHPKVAADDLRAYAETTRGRLAPGVPSAGSLWSGSSLAPGSDFKARRVDDIVLIRVVETTRASTATKTSTERDAEASAGLPRLLGLENRIPGLKDILGAESQSSFEGKGSTSRQSQLTTAVAARVTDVLANGNLVVEASRQVRINGENQGVALVGIVRPVDIDAQGAVLSTQVSDLRIAVDGRGVVSATERPGWLHRLTSVLLPF